MPTFTTDKSDYLPAENIVCTIAGSSEAPTSVTVHGVAETLQGGATSTSATITGIPLADFGAGQPHQVTPWGTRIRVVLSFPTEADAEAFVTITPDPFYPAVPMLPEVVPENAGRYSRISSGGVVRNLDLSAGDAYSITVNHDRLEAADRDLVFALWTASGITTPFYHDPIVSPYKYVCTFTGEPRVVAKTGRLFDLVSNLKGVRL